MHISTLVTLLKRRRSTMSCAENHVLVKTKNPSDAFRVERPIVGMCLVYVDDVSFCQSIQYGLKP
jgi:hypothetical protein